MGLALQGTIPRARSAEVQQQLSECVDDLQQVIQEIRTPIFDLHGPQSGTTRLRQRLDEAVAQFASDRLRWPIMPKRLSAKRSASCPARQRHHHSASTSTWKTSCPSRSSTTAEGSPAISLAVGWSSCVNGPVTLVAPSRLSQRRAEEPCSGVGAVAWTDLRLRSLGPTALVARPGVGERGCQWKAEPEHARDTGGRQSHYGRGPISLPRSLTAQQSTLAIGPGRQGRAPLSGYQPNHAFHRPFGTGSDHQLRSAARPPAGCHGGSRLEGACRPIP